MAALEVENFDEAIEHLRAQQVRFRAEPFAGPVCPMAMILDPDGNTICIHKPKPPPLAPFTPKAPGPED